MKKLKIAFFGTPHLAALFLEKLFTDVSINRLIETKLVITQPDQPTGRKRILTKSPVKTMAEKYCIPVFDFEIKNYLKISNFKLKIKDLDLALIYYYGQIIPMELLSIPKYGFWNIHFSLLPKLRGTTPATFSLILGDQKTGVSLVQTDEKLDHGALIDQKEVTVLPEETRLQLEERLHEVGFKMFAEQINNLSKHKIRTVPQDDSQATYTRFPTKDDGFIALNSLKKVLNHRPLTSEELPKLILDFAKKNNLIRNWELEIGNSTKIIYNLFRGLTPWPGIWTIVKVKGADRRLKITDLGYSSGKIFLKKVQLEGKKEVDFLTFKNAYAIF